MSGMEAQVIDEIRTDAAHAKSPLERAAERVDQAIEKTTTMTGEAREIALELKAALEEFHKLGLRRVVQRLKDDPHGKQLLFALIDEPEVFAMLAMHGLIRPDITTRVKAVVERIRPHVQSQGAEIELVDVSAHLVTVKMSGAGTGCSSTASALRSGVEEAIMHGVREITEVKVLSQQAETPLITIEALLGSAKQAAMNEHWLQGPRVDEVVEGKLFPLDVAGEHLLFVRFGQRIQAFENACAHQGLPLDRGLFDVDAGTITCPWHGFRFDCLSGECLTAPQAQLRTVPVRVIAAHIEVRLK